MMLSKITYVVKPLKKVALFAFCSTLLVLGIADLSADENGVESNSLFDSSATFLLSPDLLRQVNHYKMHSIFSSDHNSDNLAPLWFSGELDNINEEERHLQHLVADSNLSDKILFGFENRRLGTSHLLTPFFIKLPLILLSTVVLLN